MFSLDHKEPASVIPENRIFDKVVSHLPVRSEHCIGVLKGRFQCLRGLRVSIRTKEDHIAACQWMTVAMILHNLVIEFKGVEHSLPHLDRHMLADEVADGGQEAAYGGEIGNDDEARRCQLVAELMYYRTL